MVGVVVAAEGVARVQTAIQREVEVIVPDELPQVGRAEIIFLCAESVVEVEGVETNEQANMLRQMGARYAQGFLYYRPMPAKDFEALLDGGNNN